MNTRFEAVKRTVKRKVKCVVCDNNMNKYDKPATTIGPNPVGR